MEDLDLGNDFERERDLDTCAVGTDIGTSMLEFEEMEFMLLFLLLNIQIIISISM